jgi:hypothetical protein
MGRLRQWRARLTVQAVLLIIVVIVAGAAFYQRQQTAGLRTERTALEKKVGLAQESLAALQAGADPAVLQQQIQELKASSNANGQPLPTRREALAVSTALTDFAAQGGLRVVAASTGEGSLPGAGEGETVPLMTISLEVDGPLAKLIGLFGAAVGFPSAKVQNLEFRPLDDGEWNALLALVVPYAAAP